MRLKLNEKTNILCTYSSLRYKPGCIGNVWGIVLNVMRNNTKILVEENLYMNDKIIDKNILEFNNEQ